MSSIPFELRVIDELDVFSDISVLAEMIGSRVAIVNDVTSQTRYLAFDHTTWLRISPVTWNQLYSPDWHIASAARQQLVDTGRQYTMRREAVERGGFD